jgi:hypothetical protein
MAGFLFRALDLHRAADKVLKIASELIEDETQRERASNRIVGQVPRQAIPPHVGDGSLVGGDGFNDGTVNLSAEDREGWAAGCPTRQPRRR